MIGNGLGIFASSNQNGGAYNFEQALPFNGVDQFVDLPFGLTGSVITVSAWFKFDNVTQKQQPILGGGATIDWLRYRSSSTRFEARSSLGNDSFFTVPAIVPNTWYHVLFADNGSQARLFLNGVESSSGAETTGFGYNYTKLGNQSIFWLDGVLDDLLLTNTYGDPATESAAIAAGADPLSVIPTAQQLYRFNNNTNNDGSLGSSATLNNFPPSPYVPH